MNKITNTFTSNQLTQSTMKKLFLIASIALLSVGCSETWAERGDNYVKQGNYAAAYRTYISRCEDTSVSMNYRRAGCGAAYDLRTEAKRHGIDTSNW